MDHASIIYNEPPPHPPPAQSAGELENDEHTAAVMMQMVRTASRFRLSGSADQPPFKRMSGETRSPSEAGDRLTWTHLSSVLSSVILEDFVYAVTVSGQKVFVVKRQNNQREPISV